MQPAETLQTILDVTRSTAELAGRTIRSLRDEGKVDVSFKSEKDLVTNADLQAERVILDALRARFPNHAFLTEESFPGLRDPRDFHNPLWIIDPIDGTANYAHGLVHVAVSVAYAVAGEVQVGVVHAPFLGETFTAIRGGGAYLNGKPIHARSTSQLSHALVATGFPGWRGDVTESIAQLKAVLENCRDIRRDGSAALDICNIAAGRIDGYWESVKPWDMAAAALIAREAGARVGTVRPRDNSIEIPSEIDGNDFFASAPNLFEALQKLLASATGRQ